MNQVDYVINDKPQQKVVDKKLYKGLFLGQHIAKRCDTLPVSSTGQEEWADLERGLNLEAL